MRLPYCHEYNPAANRMATAIRNERISRHKSAMAKELHKRGIPFKSASCSCGECCGVMEDDSWIVGDEICNIKFDFGFSNVFEDLNNFIEKWQEHQSRQSE